jgi:hypothetical protein
MIGSAAIDVAVGLAFIYFILGAIVSHLNEMIASVLAWRATHLEEGIRALLGDSDLSEKLWNHGLVRSLAGRENRDPSYISAQAFSRALFDVIAPTDGVAPAVTDLRTVVQQLPDSHAREALLSFIATTETDIAGVRKQVEDWFDTAMDRVSGVYKRQVQRVTLALALLITFGLGVDTLAIAQALWQEPAVRAALSGAAQAATQDIEDPLGTLAQFDLPLGWGVLPETLESWGFKIAGLGLSVFAVSLGAPFWFELIKKFGNPRMTGPAPDEKK